MINKKPLQLLLPIKGLGTAAVGKLQYTYQQQLIQLKHANIELFFSRMI